MIDVYRMKGKEAIDTIHRLGKEVGWSDLELVRGVRDWAFEFRGRLRHKDVYGTPLKDLLEDISSADSGGHDIRQLYWCLIYKAPFKINLDNLDDRDGLLLITCGSQLLAAYDQSIAGSLWECPSDMDIAYAMPCDHPGLLEELKAEGYDINDDDYSPPDAL